MATQGPSPRAPVPGRRSVAIVGRPNVGKSALFNRLAGRRISIVHPESGVTRDRVTRIVDLAGERCELMDTGGLGAEPSSDPGGLAAAVRSQAELAIQDAALILLVVDLTAGLVPLDLEVADLLRRSHRPVVLAANKADHPALDAAALEFESLGFPVFPISCLHARGIEALVKHVAAALPDLPEPEQPPALAIAVAGRPNVGKSSFINRLLREERLIVSEIPGTTRDSVEVLLSTGPAAAPRHYRLIDTAGLRKTGRVRAAVDTFSLMRTTDSLRRADLVILMLDAAAGPTDLDRRIARLAIEHRRGLVLLVHKWDLAQEQQVTQRRYRAALAEALPFLDFVPVVFASSRSGYNVRRVLDAVDAVAGQLEARLPTGVLNRVLGDALARVSPPVMSGKKFKLYYAAQTGTRPPQVTLFTNYNRIPPPAFQAYLVRTLRAAFGLEGVPLLLHFRSRTAPEKNSVPRHVPSSPVRRTPVSKKRRKGGASHERGSR